MRTRHTSVPGGPIGQVGGRVGVLADTRVPKSPRRSFSPSVFRTLADSPAGPCAVHHPSSTPLPAVPAGCSEPGAVPLQRLHQHLQGGTLRPGAEIHPAAPGGRCWAQCVCGGGGAGCIGKGAGCVCVGGGRRGAAGACTGAVDPGAPEHPTAAAAAAAAAAAGAQWTGSVKASASSPHPRRGVVQHGWQAHLPIDLPIDLPIHPPIAADAGPRRGVVQHRRQPHVLL